MSLDNSDFYYKYYRAQRGGDFPVYRGSRYIQYGYGFGDVLRGFLKNVMPVIARGTSTFLNEILSRQNKGSNWSTAAKESIGTTAKSVLLDAIKTASQYGHGKKRKRIKNKNSKSQVSIVYKPHKSANKKHKLSFTKVPQFNF